MRELSSKPNGPRGAALVFFTLALIFVILPIVGLTIDGGMAYFAHSRLVAAADAAALAAGRAVNVGLTVDAQKRHIQDVAQQYVRANFPQGMLNGTLPKVTATISEDSQTHVWKISVQTSLSVGLYFMPMLGKQTADITAASTTNRRDVNLVMALDRSGSMGGVCEIMKKDAANFVSKWSNGRDRLGLITFMGNAIVDYPSTENFDSQTPSMTDTLVKLKCGGNTGSAAALFLAHQQVIGVHEPGALNVIVFFTDGVPNGYAAGPAPGPGINSGFPVKPGKTCPVGQTNPGYIPGLISQGGGIYLLRTTEQQQPISYTGTPTYGGCALGGWGQLSNTFAYVPEQDYYGNSGFGYNPVPQDANGHVVFPTSDAESDALSKNAADDAARKARADGIMIYTIGLDGDGGIDKVLLQRLANDPARPIFDPTQPVGKFYYSPNAGQLARIWNSIASEILRIAQ